MNKHGWTYKRLGDVCETSSGGTPSKNHKEYYDNGNIPWLRSGEVSQTYICETELFITQMGLDNSSAKIFPVDTVVIAMYGATVGQVGILKNAMCTNQAVCGVFPNCNFKPDFLMHFLKSKKAFFLKNAVGGAQSNISQTIIKDLRVPVPSMEEQEAIVAELDEINEAIAALQHQVADLDTLAQSTFYDMFGDPVTNPKGWDVKKLEEIASSKIGLTYKPVNVCDDGVIVLRSSNIQNSSIDLSDIVRVNAVIPDNKWVEDGDILMCTRNGSIRLVGKVARISNLPEKMTYGAFMTVIRSEFNDYLFAFFKSPAFRNQLGGAGTATINQITVRMLNNINVPVPPLALQQEFASKIEAIESVKGEINTQTAEMQTLLASRMDYYFD